jgi:hypothetical protein
MIPIIRGTGGTPQLRKGKQPSAESERKIEGGVRAHTHSLQSFQTRPQFVRALRELVE